MDYGEKMRITVDSDEGKLIDYNGVAGYVIVTVLLTEDGGLDVNRDFHVQPTDPENDLVVSDFLKKADEKLAQLFPSEPVPEAKLWIPE